MRPRIFALFFIFSSLVGQSMDTSKVATVHAYRQGRLLMGVSVSADGNQVVSLSPHNSATFYLAPGYHELTMQSGEIRPTASFTALAGKQYYFEVEYEHVVSATSLRDLRVSLSMQPRIAAVDELRELAIDPGKLTDILFESNPSGLEPKAGGASNADLPPETMPSKAIGQ